MAVPALKKPKEVMGGGGTLTEFFNLKVYPTNFMPFCFDKFRQLLGFGGNKATSPPMVPPLPISNRSIETAHTYNA